jgi:hypothetical protein
MKYTDITPDVIAEWKTKHINLSEVSIFLDDNDLSEDADTAQFIICQPTRAVLNASAKYMAEKDIQRANRLIINSCVLGGDMDYLCENNKDSRVEMKVLEEIGKLIEVKKAVVKKL